MQCHLEGNYKQFKNIVIFQVIDLLVEDYTTLSAIYDLTQKYINEFQTNA